MVVREICVMTQRDGTRVCLLLRINTEETCADAWDFMHADCAETLDVIDVVERDEVMHFLPLMCRVDSTILSTLSRAVGKGRCQSRIPCERVVSVQLEAGKELVIKYSER